MYLKIVVDHQTHYIKCGSEVNVTPGDVRQPAHPKHEDRYSVFTLLNEDRPGNFLSLFPMLPPEEWGAPDISPRTIVTNGRVYLLDDSGQTIDVIQK